MKTLLGKKMVKSCGRSHSVITEIMNHCEKIPLIWLQLTFYAPVKPNFYIKEFKTKTCIWTYEYDLNTGVIKLVLILMHYCVGSCINEQCHSTEKLTYYLVLKYKTLVKKILVPPFIRHPSNFHLHWYS